MIGDIDVAIVGAGPYGLAAAIHLGRAGIASHVFGEPMWFWRSMPEGMLLRSNRSATNMVEPEGELSLAAYEADTGQRLDAPVPLERFVEYGTWVQRRAVPDVDRRLVRRLARAGEGFELELGDGQRLRARRAVVACGIEPFAWRPSGFDGLPCELVSHTSDHRDVGVLRGRRVAVVGGGQSALESAALLRERGADVEVFIRARRVVWLRGVSIKRRLGPLGPVVYAPTDVGPLWYSRLVALPDVFRRIPRRAQTRIARRCIRPACSAWARVRLEGIPLHVGTSVVRAVREDGRVRITLGDGRTHEADHVLLGTGYRVDVARYRFLDRELVAGLQHAGGYPVLRRGFESSVAGLHVLGAPAAWSFGPTMRFVSGTWYAGRALARAVSEERRAARPGVRR